MTKPWEQYHDEIPDGLQDRTSSYPYIQWVNNGQSVQPPQDRGGWAMPTDQAVDHLIPGQFTELVHRGGATTEAVFAQAIQVVPIRTRFCWVKDGERVEEYEAGARGKLQVLCLTHNNDGQGCVGPYMLTVKGMVSKHLSQAIREHAQAVRKLTGGGAMPWMFWCRLLAGNVEMAGSHDQQSPITAIQRGDDPTEADFIGDEAVQTIIGLAEEIEQWAGAWKNGKPGASSTPHPTEGVTMTVEAALQVKTPVKSNSFPQGTPLGALVKGGNAGLGFLKYLQGKSREYPEAGKAAALLLDDLQRALFLAGGGASAEEDNDDTLPF